MEERCETCLACLKHCHCMVKTRYGGYYNGKEVEILEEPPSRIPSKDFPCFPECSPRRDAPHEEVRDE